MQKCRHMTPQKRASRQNTVARELKTLDNLLSEESTSKRMCKEKSNHRGGEPAATEGSYRPIEGLQKRQARAQCYDRIRTRKTGGAGEIAAKDVDDWPRQPTIAGKKRGVPKTELSRNYGGVAPDRT